MSTQKISKKIRQVYKLINYQNIEFEWNENLRKARKILNEIQSEFKHPDVHVSDKPYPMTCDQPSQIDCRVTICKFYKGSGKCVNTSPAITLNENGKFVCWSKVER